MSDSSAARRANAAASKRQPARPAAARSADDHGRRVLIGSAIAVGAAILAYLPALRNGFIWDDPLVLQQLRAMRGLGDLIVMPPEVPRYYYRPLIFVSYLLDRALGGETPFWFHLSVVAVHALNAVLVLRLGLRLFGGDAVLAAAGAVLFAVFPTHVESVAWIAGRSDVIVCTFLLLTSLLSLRREAWWTAWLAGVTLFLALLSKEMAVSGLLIVPALDWLSSGRLYWRRYPPLLLAAVAYFLLRQGSVGSLVGGAAVADPPAQLAADLVRAVGLYVARSIVPWGLSPYIPSVPDSPLYLLIGIAAPALALAAVLRRWRQARWPLAALLLWFGLTLAPSLAVIVRRSASAPVADRYLYVPSVASSLMLAWAILWLVRWRRAPVAWFVAAVAVLAVPLAVVSGTYARVWTDNYTFWSEVVSAVPGDPLAQRELAAAMLARGQLDAAEDTLRRVLSLPSDDEGRVMAYSNLGLIYRRQGKLTDAAGAFQSALAIGPHPVLFHNLGMTHMGQAEQSQKAGDTAAVASHVRQARDAFEKALQFQDQAGGQAYLEQFDPAKTHALLGQVLVSLGDPAGARRQFEAALRLQPAGPVADITRRQLQRLP